MALKQRADGALCRVHAWTRDDDGLWLLLHGIAQQRLGGPLEPVRMISPEPVRSGATGRWGPAPVAAPGPRDDWTPRRRLSGLRVRRARPTSCAVLAPGRVDAVYSRWAVIAGRVMNDIQFTAPLRPDTTVTGTLTITAVVPVSPHRSLVRKRGIIRDADAQVLSMELETYVAQQNPLEPRPR